MPNFLQEALAGKAIYLKNCNQCHGRNGLGTESGPPLLHPFYRPGHHDDVSIKNAVKNGAMAHHWPYGDMAPVRAVGDSGIPKLIAFIRELQRANGIK